MSDRTPSSVRTGARTGTSAAPADAATGESAPVSATQAIPTTGAQRAVRPATRRPRCQRGRSRRLRRPPRRAPARAIHHGRATVGGPARTARLPADGRGRRPPRGDRPEGQGRPRHQGPRPAKVGGRGPRRARLQLRHIDTWSALKISLVLSIALFFIWMVAVGVLYGVLSALGVFDTLNDLFGQLGSASGSEAAGDVVTPGVVFGGAAVIGAINIVLMTALCTVGTFIYNLCSDLVGGLELTLSERD